MVWTVRKRCRKSRIFFCLKSLWSHLEKLQSNFFFLFGRSMIRPIRVLCGERAGATARNGKLLLPSKQRQSTGSTDSDGIWLVRFEYDNHIPISTHLSVGTFPGGYGKYILINLNMCHLARLVNQNLSSDIKKLTVINVDSCIYCSVNTANANPS